MSKQEGRTFTVSTHYAEGMEPPWLAVNMTDAVEALSGYQLTDEEKTNLAALMAGYCRLIDEYGLSGYGNTEAEAVFNLLKDV
jgi:hypothetical protein